MAVTFLDHFPAKEYPHLAELTTEHVLQPGYDYGSEFRVRAQPDPRRPRTGAHPDEEDRAKTSQRPAHPLARDLAIRAEPPNQTPRSS